jgi:hypothetical protein
MVEREDDDGVYRSFPAIFTYAYSFGEREFLGTLEDDTVGDGFWGTDSYAEAVTEARRRKPGDPYPILIDPAEPEVVVERPPRVFPHLIGAVVLCLLMAYGLSGSYDVEAIIFVWLVSGVMGLWMYKIKLPRSEEIPPSHSLGPYLKMLEGHPPLGYVPQNQLRQFDSLPALLQAWGCPDELWMEDSERGLSLLLTFRHGSDWSQAWTHEFRIQEGREPIPLGPPRESVR